MSFFITAGSGYKSGSSYANSNTNNGLSQMTNAIKQKPSSSMKESKSKFKSSQ